MASWRWDPTDYVLMDLETQSPVNLREVGSRAYLSDPDTRLLSGVFLEGSEVTVWVPPGRAPIGWDTNPDAFWPEGYSREGYTLSVWKGEGPPPSIVAAIERGTTFVAHNAAGFDAEAWERLVGGPQPTWYDTLPCARAAGLPGGLDALGLRLTGRGKDAGKDALKILYTAKRSPRGTIYTPGNRFLWESVLRYNVADVLLLERVFSHVDDYGEVDVLGAHFAIEDRGIAIDPHLLEVLRELWKELQGSATDKVAEWTEGIVNGGNIKSVPQVKAWLKSLGLEVTTLNRKSLELLYTNPDAFFGEIPDNVDMGKVIDVLRARQTATRISTSKIDRLLQTTAGTRDGRARGILSYWGAVTGRWSGRGFQPHNLSRGVGDLDVEGAISAAQNGTLTLDWLRDAVSRCEPVAGLKPTLDDALSTLLRPTLCAAPGRTLAIVDYASVEARGIAWIAEQEDLLDVFRTGGDPYCVMGSTIFGRPITKKDKAERQIGKIVVLGCIAEGTPVLTDRGWVEIQNVQLTDRVWDGVEWVTHGGVIDKGLRECVTVCGVTLTPDHEILTDGGWVEAWQHEGNTRSPLRGTYAGDGQFFTSNADHGEGSSGSGVNAVAGSAPESTPTICRTGKAGDATNAPSGNPRQRTQSTQPSARTDPTDRGYSIESAPSSADAPTRGTGGGRTTGQEGFGFTPHGLTIDGGSWRISSRSPDGTTPDWRLTGRTTCEGMNRETYVSPPAPSSVRTVVRTFDIVNAGPRHSFQAGPLVCHNCGYGMSDGGFDAFCKSARVDLESAGTSALECVTAYRDAFPRIAGKCPPGKKWRSGGVWKDLQNAAENAIKSGGKRTTRAGKCTFTLVNGHLEMALPSGRILTYRDCSIQPRVPGWAITSLTPVAPRPTIVYTHPHGYEGILYGGLIAENVVQALCRDLLATALVRCEGEGLETVLHVHDEIVAETDAGSGEAEVLQRLAEIMSEPPEWADGFPVGVEGFTCPRYTKSPFKGSWTVEGLNGIVHVSRAKQK